MDVDLLALVFYLYGGRIKGVTRLNKIVFLLQEEFGLNGYNFSASKYGPWSGELADSIDGLEKEGLIKIEEFSDPIYSFIQENPAKIITASGSLMERGRRVFEDISAKKTKFWQPRCAGESGPTTACQSPICLPMST
jgi:uncharacterized protein YwgA